MPSINTEQQAEREAILRQQLSENIKRTITLQSGVEAIQSIKGDIIGYQHPGNSKVVGGRIDKDVNGDDAYSGDTIYIDQKITLDSATYSGNAQILVRNKDTDTISTFNITSPFDVETNVFVVAESAGGSFNRFEPFIIGRATGEIYDYRVVSVQRTSKQAMAIEAIQYVSASYFHADFGGGVIEL
jgi:hypothetical protein